jgi:hypothetical protein
MDRKSGHLSLPPRILLLEKVKGFRGFQSSFRHKGEKDASRMTTLAEEAFD